MRLTCGVFYICIGDSLYLKRCISPTDLFFHPKQDILYLLLISIASIKTSRGRTHFQHERFYIKQEKKRKMFR